MEKINTRLSPKTNTSQSAEKGTVSIRKRGNSYEARIRLDIKANYLKGGDKNPRLTRSGITEDIAKQRLAQLIIDKYLVKSNQEIVDEEVFSDECEKNLKGFSEYMTLKEDFVLHHGVNSFVSFDELARIWLNFKRDAVNPSTGKKISPKTVETYVYTLKKHIIPNFSQYTISEMTKEVIEEYISNLRKEYPRAAKDTFLMIRQVLKYCKDKGLIRKVPDFDLKFPKKKRSKKTKLIYLPSDRQPIWLDILEKDGRDFCLLFATLLQTGMRPEEGCGLLLSNILFDKNIIHLHNAHKDIVHYDKEFNIIGHEYIDDELKTEESYRDIPISDRLKRILITIYDNRKKLREIQNKVFDPSKEYVFLNTLGNPYVPERLDKKLSSIIKKYNLEHMTVYGFRHSFATLMSELGMDKEVLREIMGHADYETTEFYYVYISEERKKKEFEKISNKTPDIFENKKENQSTERKKIGYTGKKIIRKKNKALIKISA